MEKLSYNDKLRMKMFREQGLRAKSIIFSYRDKGWKLSTVRKVCKSSRPHWLSSAVLRKPGSGRPATVSACTVCRCKTIFTLVGPTKL